MRIQEYRSIGGRDFHATMECEHCGSTQELTTGYDDAYYHQHVIPAMTCKVCGKNRAGEIPAESNDHGLKHVEARLTREPDYWEKLEHQYAGQALQARIIADQIRLLQLATVGPGDSSTYAAEAAEDARTLIARLKGET